MHTELRLIETLEEVDHIEAVWAEEKRQILEKDHPSSFPALPPIPVSRFVEPEFFEIERKHLWRKTWVLAGFANELPETGSYKSLEIVGTPIFLVRDRQNEIRAFYNACQHRGTAVCFHAQGRADRFHCPYHNWTYELDGTLVYVPQEHEFPGLERQEKSLKPLRCERVGNLIFVNFDANSRSLDDFLGDFPKLWRDVPFDRVELHTTFSIDLNCNWKCVHDNFNETYHVPHVHPQTVHVALDHRCHAKFLFPNGHAEQITKVNRPGIAGGPNS